jgi:ketosteroid isomerase-like protein
MAHPHHEIARAFFAAFFSGDVKDEFLTQDFSAWTTLGPLQRIPYQQAVKSVISLFAGGKGSFNYTIDAITAEDDRAVVEIRSKGTFADGEPYEMTYIFVLRLRDGRVASIAEHFNPVPVMEKMFPRMQQPVIAKAPA